MIATRSLESELLDEIPADDPLATESRRDLRRLNFWMGHYGLMARALKDAFLQRAPTSLVEIGAGDGTFLLNVAKRLCRSWTGVNVTMVDRQQLVRGETLQAFRELGWRVTPIQADVFDWLAKAPYEISDAIIANLFLHHFSATQLQELITGTMRRARLVVALEPRRSLVPLLFSHLLWSIGCNRVTRHDAVVSVRAGFDGKELSAFWPGDWAVAEQRAGLFSHLLIAEKKDRTVFAQE